MLTLPEQVLLVKLHYQNGESVIAALRSYRHKKGIQTGKGPMTSVAAKNLITKFEATGC